MLRVTLLGNLGADPELRYSQKGAPMVTFRVAVNQVRTGPDGERQENTEWFRVRTMGRLAESAQRLTKGSRVLVVGRLDITHYTSREGEQRVGYDVWGDEVQNLSARPAELEPESELAAAPVGADATPSAAGPPAANGAGSKTEELEDLPF
jgi:single-strand DNA-binding protein